MTSAKTFPQVFSGQAETTHMHIVLCCKHAIECHKISGVHILLEDLLTGNCEFTVHTPHGKMRIGRAVDRTRNE